MLYRVIGHFQDWSSHVIEETQDRKRARAVAAAARATHQYRTVTCAGVSEAQSEREGE